MGPRRRLGKPERRAALADAAMAVFAREGYHGASTAKIATEAGVSEGLLYEHFASKRDLHVALLAAEAERLVAMVAAVVDTVDPAAPAEHRLRAAVDAFLRFVAERPFAWRVLFRDPPADPEIAAVHRRAHRRASEAIVGMLALERRPPGERLWSDADLEVVAELIKATTNALAAWWYEHPEVEREVLVDRFMDFAWTGLAALTARPGLR